MNKVSRYGRNADMIKFGTDFSNQNFRDKDTGATEDENKHRNAHSMYNLEAVAPKTNNKPDNAATTLEPAIEEKGISERAEVIEGPQRGRRYRAVSNASKTTIKIKKMIPLKDNTPQKVDS